MLLSLETDPITEAAREDAEPMLDIILDKYRFSWPDSYRIGDYTWGAEYRRRYQEKVNEKNDVAFYFGTLDLACTVKDSYEQASETSGFSPYATLGTTALYTGMNLLWNEEPGIAGFPDFLGINSSMDKEIEKAHEESQFIDNSNYKYLVYSGRFLWVKGARQEFIDDITFLQNDIISEPRSHYNTSADNYLYNQALIRYLGTIKNMNINYKQSVSAMKYDLSNIDNKYE